MSRQLITKILFIGFISLIFLGAGVSSTIKKMNEPNVETLPIITGDIPDITRNPVEINFQSNMRTGSISLYVDGIQQSVSTSPVLITEEVLTDGIHNVSVVAENSAGRFEWFKTITVDNTPPEGLIVETLDTGDGRLQIGIGLSNISNATLVKIGNGDTWLQEKVIPPEGEGVLIFEISDKKILQNWKDITVLAEDAAGNSSFATTTIPTTLHEEKKPLIWVTAGAGILIILAFIVLNKAKVRKSLNGPAKIVYN